MKEILKLVLSLTFICALAGASLAYVSRRTAEPIEHAKVQQRNEKMALLLPAEVSTTALLDIGAGTGVTVYGAYGQDGGLLAYCAESADPSGFGGEIRVLVGLNLDGTIRGVLVSENSETPGIGSQVCERSARGSFWDLFRKKQADSHADARALVPNAYLDGYNGQQLSSTAPLQLKDTAGPGAIVPVSGATVSSRAVLNAVNRVCMLWPFPEK